MHDLVVFTGIYLLLGCLVFLVGLIATAIWILYRAYVFAVGSGTEIDKAFNDVMDGMTNAVSSFAPNGSKADNAKALVRTIVLWPYQIPLGVSTVIDLAKAYMEENFHH